MLYVILSLNLKQQYKEYQTVEDRRLGKMMLIHGIYDNILIPNLYYWVCTKIKQKMRALQRDKYFLGCKQKKLTKGGCMFIRQHW